MGGYCSKKHDWSKRQPQLNFYIGVFKGFYTSYIQAIRAVRGWKVGVGKKHSTPQYEKYTLPQIKEVALGHMCKY